MVGLRLLCFWDLYLYVLNVAVYLMFHSLIISKPQDICISAVKEKDIEAKLKQVMADWAVIDLTFTNFKNRGELLIKASDTMEIITLLEDSLMVLNSLASNR